MIISINKWQKRKIGFHIFLINAPGEIWLHVERCVFTMEPLFYLYI